MTNKEIGLQKVQDLVIRFNEQIAAYKNVNYNETQTRRDFIDPFFKALGWDIDNTQGSAESYREVIHEDRVKVGKATKAPDYSFRLSGGQRLFFVEAKKPSILIKEDIQPAYQIRRYGWSAKLNVSIITDFEEFAIYDCTKKPNPADKSSVARVKYLTFNDYVSEWDFLWNTFSKEAVLKGSFDKFIGGNANKKGTATVDKEFLYSLDQWRTLLAETISKENKQLDEDELNFVVQQTLDRIIFLRICEDRSIEPYGSLQNILKSGNYYKNLLQEFKQADDKYNSGLFNFKKDKLSNQLTINNKTLKTIINQLYYPDCPYEFSVLSVEILGSAYEQFLGKTITINNRGKAVIELKPEVRKAGGVYYTPQYIVNYIVENTVGNLTKNKTPTQVAEIKIVDPACGSGSFLIGAYQYLLDWHLDYYLQNPNNKNPITPKGNLTTTEKKQILLNNIYGVDIDTNAVEVTKLSLLLKCMEGETQASIAHQMTMFKERVLPTLDDNIKSGNSLIDTDYYDNQLDFGEERKIKPFSWQKEFPVVFAPKIIEEDLKAYHVTCVMHNTRVSKRMIEYNVKRGTPEYLLPNEEDKLFEIIAEHIKENNLKVLALNICADHLHICLVCIPESLTTIVGKLKSMSARAFNIWRGITVPSENNEVERYTAEPRGHAPLANTAPLPVPLRGKTQNSLWAQKFNRKEIETEQQLWNVINYVTNNRNKHNLPPSSQAILHKIENVLTTYENAFKPQILNGGFDVVIGNPPYVKVSEKSSIIYFNNKYLHQDYQQDLYLLFLEKYQHLLVTGGKLGIIIPNTWLQSIKFRNIRRYLIDNYYWERILNFKKRVFDAIVDTHVLVFEKNDYIKNNAVIIDFNDSVTTNQLQQISQYSLPNNGDVINIVSSESEKTLFEKIKENSVFIKDICFSNVGVKPFQVGKGKPKQTREIVTQKPFVKENQEKPNGEYWLPLMRGSLMNRYINHWQNNSWIDYGEWLAEPRNAEVFKAKEKIIIRQTSDKIVATIIGKNIICRNNLHILISETISHHFILGVLNSKLTDFYYTQINPEKGEVLAEVKKSHIDQLPLPQNYSSQSYNQIINHVEQLLQLNKELLIANLESKKTLIKSKIEYNEDKINALVYQLYNLSEDEIKLIENN